MSQADLNRAGDAEQDWPPIDPWALMAIAGGAAAIAVALSFTAWWTPVALLTLAGLITAGGAVALRPKSPPILAAAGATALVFFFAMDRDWDSARMVVRLLAVIALVAAALVALPGFLGQIMAAGGSSEKEAEQLQERGRGIGRFLNRAIVSLLLLLHFGGILCAVLSVPPPGRDQSWLAQWGWSIMQPYLQFAYLINAYHFYAPEPGPPALLWFYVEYEDGSSRWIEIPKVADHDIDILGQEYTRRLSIGESVNQVMTAPVTDLVRQRRGIAMREGIPLHPELSEEAQYRVPADHARKLLCEYARFVAQHFPSETNPSAAAVRVKIYRVVHRMLEPNEMAGLREYPEPDAAWTYWPYYQGEFVKPPPDPTNPDPNQPWVLKDNKDPMLYWLVPIYRELRPVIDPTNPQRNTGEMHWETLDTLHPHARAGAKKGGQP